MFMGKSYYQSAIKYRTSDRSCTELHPSNTVVRRRRRRLHFNPLQFPSEPDSTPLSKL